MRTLRNSAHFARQGVCVRRRAGWPIRERVTAALRPREAREAASTPPQVGWRSAPQSSGPALVPGRFSRLRSLKLGFVAGIVCLASAAAQECGIRFALAPAPGHGYTAAVGGLRLLVDTGSTLTWACVNDSQTGTAERGVFRVRYGDGSVARGRLVPGVATPLAPVAALTHHYTDWLVGAAPSSTCRGRLRGLNGVLGLGPHEPARRPGSPLSTGSLYASIEPGDRGTRLSLLSALRAPHVLLQPATRGTAPTLCLSARAAGRMRAEGSWEFSVPRPLPGPGGPALAQWRVPAGSSGPSLLARGHGRSQCWEAAVRLRGEAGSNAGRASVLFDTGAWAGGTALRPSHKLTLTPPYPAQVLRSTTFRVPYATRCRCPTAPARVPLPPPGLRWPPQWAQARRRRRWRPWPTSQARRRAPASTCACQGRGKRARCSSASTRSDVIPLCVISALW